MKQMFSEVREFPATDSSTSIIFEDHNQCLALSNVFRGRLCDQLVRGLPKLRFSAGEPIYPVGQLSRRVYFLSTGLVKSSVTSDAGRELILQVHKPGDIFGNFCFCESGQLDQAVALEDSEIIEVQFDQFISHLQKNRQAILEFLSTIGDRLSESYEQLDILSFDRRMERLVLILLKLADELGVPSREGIQIAHYFKQEELAEMIAGRREVVSSLLNQLRKMGLIRYSRRQRITINKKALQDYLNSIRVKAE